MKILLVVYKDDERVGGSLRVAEIIASSLIAAGVDVNVACAYGNPGRVKENLGDRCFFMNSTGRGDFKAWFRYRKFVRKLSPDIIHYVDCVGWMTLAGIFLKSKRIMHQHSRPDFGENGRKKLKYIRWLVATGDRVIAISQGAGKQLVEKCGVKKEKLSVIYNAVDPNYLTSNKSSSIDKLKTSSDINILGMAIRVVEDKGVEDALRLLKNLPSNFHLVIAGDGPARKKMEVYAANLGVSDRLRWLGSVSNIIDFYESIDYYLFMSWYEGFGLSVAEAMFCRKPVVGLLGDGEIAEQEYPLVTVENSLLIKRSNLNSFTSEPDERIIKSLAEEIVNLESDFNKRDLLTTNAFNWVNERFTSKVQLKNLLKAYNSTLK